MTTTKAFLTPSKSDKNAVQAGMVSGASGGQHVSGGAGTEGKEVNADSRRGKESGSETRGTKWRPTSGQTPKSQRREGYLGLGEGVLAADGADETTSSSNEMEDEERTPTPHARRAGSLELGDSDDEDNVALPPPPLFTSTDYEDPDAIEERGEGCK